MFSRKFQRAVRLISVPIAFAFVVVLYREFQYNNEIYAGRYELVGLESNIARPIKEALQKKLNEIKNKENVPHAALLLDDPRVAEMLGQDGFNVVEAPIPADKDSKSPIESGISSPIASAKKNDEKEGFARVQGKIVEHGIMNQEDVQVEVKKSVELEDVPLLKDGLTESRDYVDDIKWPDTKDLDIPGDFIKENPEFYSKGRNRDRQMKHGTVLPQKRTPDLIITGAKKCGTTALKIFMNYHPWFQDNPGEQHFFNRAANFKNGYDWYVNQMPLVFDDEICYEKTPDYFDRPFVPERMSHLTNADNVKFIHVLCDPVRRSFSHFLHMFTVQSSPKLGPDGKPMAQGGFEFLQGNFGEIPREEAFEQTIHLALKSLLGGKDIDTVTDDEIRESVNEYFTRWDLKPSDKRRVFPLRAPDAMLTGSLYSVHIRTFLHYFRQDQMLYLDATELVENPGKSLRRVAQFMNVPAVINENNFYFDEAKGYYCMTPPAETGRASFCLGSEKGRSKNKSLPDKLKDQIRRFYKPFLEDLSTKYSGETYEHWDW